MLERFISKEEKEDFIQSMFIIGATLVCSILFIVVRIFPRIEIVTSRFLNRGVCKPQEDKNARPIKKRHTILGKTLRR